MTAHEPATCHCNVCSTKRSKRTVLDVGDPEPPPIKNNYGNVQDLVIADIERRKALGLKKYGTLLQIFNGRDALKDAYEESLDQTIYLRQALEERNELATAQQLGRGRSRFWRDWCELRAWWSR